MQNIEAGCDSMSICMQFMAVTAYKKLSATFAGSDLT